MQQRLCQRQVRGSAEGKPMGDFSEKVLAVVKRIPPGKVASYGQVGRMIGAPRSARYVGYALRANPAPGQDPHCIPCHRVVFKDGSMATGFAFGGPGEQRKMLEVEGVAFTSEGKVDMAKHLWDGREIEEEGEFPLAPPADFDWARELGEEA